jgi:uncharacterized iron-regulated membrane protein
MLKRIHTWLGLLTFINLTVYGIAGLSAALQTVSPEKAEPDWIVTERAFVAPRNATDMQVADEVCKMLGLSLATPVQKPAIHRNDDGTLWFDFWHVNGRHKVTVLEKQGRIRVEEYRGSLTNYLDAMHATTAAFTSNDWRMTLWAYYNELAMWALIGMILSGVYLWLSARPRHRLAQLSLAAGSLVFIVLWAMTR